MSAKGFAKVGFARSNISSVQYGDTNQMSHEKKNLLVSIILVV